MSSSGRRSGPDRAAIRTRWARWAVATRSARSSSPANRTARQNEIKLEGIAGLHGRDGLLGPVFQFLGVFLRQDGHDGPGGHAVCDGVAFARALPLSVFGPVLFWALRRLASICAAVATV